MVAADRRAFIRWQQLAQLNKEIKAAIGQRAFKKLNVLCRKVGRLVQELQSAAQPAPGSDESGGTALGNRESRDVFGVLHQFLQDFEVRLDRLGRIAIILTHH